MKRLVPAFLILVLLGAPLLAPPRAVARTAMQIDASPYPSPPPAEIEQAVQTVRAFSDAIYRRDFVAAFQQVRGIDDPVKAGADLTQTLRDNIASLAFRQLSGCQNNVEALASAIESYARDNNGRYPGSLEALTKGDLYLTELPVCPAHGIYEYRSTPQGFRVFCHVNAHSEIGVKGDFPAYVSGSGLTLGNQKINLQMAPVFLQRSVSITYEDFIPDFNVIVVRLDEESAIFDVGMVQHRSSLFQMSRKDGKWLVDLYLSNRDMLFVYDFDTFLRTAAIPKQVLLFYQISQSPVPFAQRIQSRADLELRVCEANLRSISLAIESWSVENGGSYPKGGGFTDIVPRYLRRLPRCPAGGVYVYSHAPHSGKYMVRCWGHAHAAAGLTANYPTIDPVNGLVAPMPKKSPD